MGKPILLLRLEGPLQSWGIRSRWSKRDTGPEPTKSAIIGLLGCAAGILRPDWHAGKAPDRTLEKWDEELLFGVRVDRPGVIETDYHTVEGRMWQADGGLKTASSKSGTRYDKAMLEPPRTEETWREYVHDAAFLIGLLQKDGGREQLDKFADDLQNPKWSPYLGRKACLPSRPPFERVTEDHPTLKEALMSEPWSAPRQMDLLRCSFRRQGSGPCNACSKFGPPGQLVAWIEDPTGDYERADALRLNQLRFYDNRSCHRISVPTAGLRWSIR